MNMRPKIAIIDPNTLSALGLKAILQNVMPIMTVDTFGSLAELQANNPDSFFHYFTAMAVVVENMQFFMERKRKTIVLTLSLDTMSQLSDFKCLCINVPEKELVRSLSKDISPSKSKSVAKILSNVVLPHPDGPFNITRPYLGNDKLMFLRT